MSEITNELSDNINYTTVKFEELSEVSEELWNFKKLSQNKNLTFYSLKFIFLAKNILKIQ